MEIISLIHFLKYLVEHFSMSTFQNNFISSEKTGLLSKELRIQPSNGSGRENSLPRIAHAAFSKSDKREASFKGKWSDDKTQDPADMAKAGFFCKESAEPGKDKVFCFTCGLGLQNWESPDKPWVEHAKWAPQCPYLLRMKGKDFVDKVQKRVRLERAETKDSCDECSRRRTPTTRQSNSYGSHVNLRKQQNEVQQMSSAILEKKLVTSRSCVKSAEVQRLSESKICHLSTETLKLEQGNVSVSDQNKLKPSVPAVGRESGVKRLANGGPIQSTASELYRFPQYEDYDSRLDTYKYKWISQIKQERMAEAGFFYVGGDDDVRCFCCGIRLRKWVKGDDPWIEHVKWCQSCRYVRCVKGTDFITKAICILQSDDLETDAVPIDFGENNDIETDTNEEEDVDGSMNEAMTGVHIVNDSLPQTKEQVLEDPFRLEVARLMVEEGHMPKNIKLAVIEIITKGEKDWREITDDNIRAKLKKFTQPL